MGVPLFGVNISGILARTMGAGLPRVRLLKKQVGAIDESAPTDAPSISHRSVPCRGFEDDSQDRRRDGTQVQTTGRVVVILGDTLPRGTIPEPGDLIEILGETLEITGEGVSTDPARATYSCRCVG